VERALDPELIRIAMGENPNLPSPEEISNLLAEAELAILLRSPEISERLIAIGWYLHAIASSKYALRTYGVERQRTAFQVTAHIFDILLQTPERSRIERLEYCFAAQIAYIRSRIDPNALALYRREFSGELGPMSLLSDSPEIGLSCGVAFLGFDAGYIFSTTRELLSEISNLVKVWQIEDIISTPFGSVASVVAGTRDLMSFLVYGRIDLLERARERLLQAVQTQFSEQDQISRWVAAHLLNLADDLEQASIWTKLPPSVPSPIRKAFSMGHPRILTLWPPQLDLLERSEEEVVEVEGHAIDDKAEEESPLSPVVKRIFLSTPTSSGKTLLAQLFVVTHLATEKTSVCYVAPTRSLCHEIRKSLQARLRYLGKNIIADMPEGNWLDNLVESLMDDEPSVEVMTPERLSYLIRSEGRQVLERFGLFIFDEVHLVGDPGRGWTLEEDLAYLHYATLNDHHRIILMSAAIGNKNHFIEWMSGSQDKIYSRTSDWRGPRRLHAIWRTEAGWEDRTTRENPRARKYHITEYVPLFGRLDLRISHTGIIRSLQTSQSVGTLVRKIDSDGNRLIDREQSTPFYKALVSIIQYLGDFGSVLIIESTRPSTVRVARAIADEQETINNQYVQQLIDLVEARLGRTHPLWGVLQKGVAYHHGSLPGEIRSAIEDAVSEEYIKYLVATTTLTEGVNLPVQSVVIASQGAHSDEGYQEYITGSKLINAIGRAGRATKETEGIVVLARQAAPSQQDFERLSPSSDDLQVISLLATREALDSLAGFEELQREAEDAIFRTHKGAASDFIKFVWFIAAQLEDLGEATSLEHIREVLQHTLAWIQLDEQNQERWIATAKATLDQYVQTEIGARRRWATSGTTIGSAAEIESIARELTEKCKRTEISDNVIEVLNIIIGDGRLERILRLPEAPRRRIYDQRGGSNRAEIPVALSAMLRDWLQGSNLINLSETYFSQVGDIDYRFEQLGDYIYDYLELYLPWVVGTIISWTNNMLQSDGREERLPQILPAYIRWGVSKPSALRLMFSGIQSRVLANKISDVWEAEDKEGDIHSWIRSMSLGEWQKTFDASPSELRSILEFSRDQQSGVAVELVTNGIAELEVISHLKNIDRTSVSLVPTGISDLAPIEIRIGDDVVGQVQSSDQADIRSLINTGLILDINFSASSGKGRLTLTLLDPEE
jgi:replicative superfamily II helicase